MLSCCFAPPPSPLHLFYSLQSVVGTGLQFTDMKWNHICRHELSHYTHICKIQFTAYMNTDTHNQTHSVAISIHTVSLYLAVRVIMKKGRISVLFLCPLVLSVCRLKENIFMDFYSFFNECRWKTLIDIFCADLLPSHYIARDVCLPS